MTDDEKFNLSDEYRWEDEVQEEINPHNNNTPKSEEIRKKIPQRVLKEEDADTNKLSGNHIGTRDVNIQILAKDRYKNQPKEDVDDEDSALDDNLIEQNRLEIEHQYEEEIPEDDTYVNNKGNHFDENNIIPEDGAENEDELGYSTTSNRRNIDSIIELQSNNPTQKVYQKSNTSRKNFTNKENTKPSEVDEDLNSLLLNSNIQNVESFSNTLLKKPYVKTHVQNNFQSGSNMPNLSSNPQYSNSNKSIELEYNSKFYYIFIYLLHSQKIISQVISTGK
jgi:hypothetical protein